MTSDTRDTSYPTGELWIRGDQACGDGDLHRLGAIVEALALRASEPLHCELLAITELCRSAPERAPDAWFRLKARLFSAGAAPTP